MKTMHAGERRLLRWLMVLLAASALTLYSSGECVSAESEADDATLATGQDTIGENDAGALTGACSDSGDFGPNGLAPTFTQKPFWIVLGLVVLGWLVLAADMPG